MPTLTEGPTRWAADSMTTRERYQKYKGNGVKDARGNLALCPRCRVMRPVAKIKRRKCDVCRGKGK